MPFCVTCRDENTGQEVEPLIVEAASEVAARSYAEARGMIVGEVVFLPILKRIGYWTAGEQPPVYPHPARLVDPLWRCADRARIVAYLQSGLCIASALGHSWCRVCRMRGKEMGSGEFSDGEWLWPEGLAHYIEAHQVRLPEPVVESMERRGWRVPADLGPLDGNLVDESFWLTWASQVQQQGAEASAAPDLPRD